MLIAVLCISVWSHFIHIFQSFERCSCVILSCAAYVCQHFPWCSAHFGPLISQPHEGAHFVKWASLHASKKSFVKTQKQKSQKYNNLVTPCKIAKQHKGRIYKFTALYSLFSSDALNRCNVITGYIAFPMSCCRSSKPPVTVSESETVKSMVNVKIPLISN